MAELQAHDLRRGGRPGLAATSSTRSPPPPTGPRRPPGRAGRHRVRRDRARLTRAPHRRDRASRAARGRGADLLPAPRPRGLHPLPALRPADLPGLHARRGGRASSARSACTEGAQDDPQRPDGVRRAAARPTPAITSIVLIGINVAVWVAIMATGGRASRLVDWLALRPNGLLRRPGQRRLRRHREAVCTASGGDLAPRRRATAPTGSWSPRRSPTSQIWHIGFNMLALWVLGPQLELAIGRARFLALYLLSGAGRLGAGLLGRARVRPDPRRLRRDLRPDGRAARGRAQGAAATCSGS